ncbi:hypothetical protein ACQP00_10505 [Dactylosporangium sp. CS-047395]|uniref:hypothetical protein n=1 Tax=Dactylosporangium sp. CS-047395 TaxID=3239936 RepID=UPI003D9133D1
MPISELSLPVPEPEPAPTGIGWLRATVSRFANGEVHARRRAIVEELLAGIDPAELSKPYEGHPVAPLAAALRVDDGVIRAVVEDVRTAAAAYQTGDPAADAAVDRLVGVFGGAYDERTAARIQLLVQACDATAKLVERARTRPVDEVLRDDPPVPATRRVADDGTVVAVSLADNPFGAGPRACPGRAHALALVEGARR